jgi:hypothetical protein
MPKTRHPDDLRNTRRYQKLRLVVIDQEPWCWLRLTGCKGRSTTADHVITVSECIRLGRPDLITARENMRGACGPCNYARRDRPVDAIRHLMGAADNTPMRAFD